MRTVFLWSGAALVLAAGMSSAAAQQVTTKYTYDQRGRLAKVEHPGGPNATVVVTQQFDPADNRLQRTVAGRSQRPVLVVPLNKFTPIPIDK